MAEDQPKMKEGTIKRRAFLKTAGVGIAALVTGVAVQKAVESMSGEPRGKISKEFDDVFNKLRLEHPETERPGQAGYTAYEFRQGIYRYTLIRNNTGDSPERIIQSTYYHGIEPDAPNDPIIEYSIDGNLVTANWLWKRPHGDERADKLGLSDIEIASLATRLRADYDAWSKPIK